MDIFNAYRKLFASTTDEDVCWWFCGTIVSNLEGLCEVPICQAEFIMSYKTEMPAPDTLKILRREIGYYRDPITGEIAQSWFNPLTGKIEISPSFFKEGPSVYTVTKVGDGVEITLLQNRARIKKITLVSSVSDGRVSLMQCEDKLLSRPRFDGSFADLDTPAALNTSTTLSIYGSLDDVLDPKKTNIRASGYYRSKQTPNALSDMSATNLWGHSYVIGVMQKAAPDEILNPVAWQRLKTLAPQFFDGERVSPVW
jgi:hypothetical protein